jgi:hypothetical protein
MHPAAGNDSLAEAKQRERYAGVMEGYFFRPSLVCVSGAKWANEMANKKRIIAPASRETAARFLCRISKKTEIAVSHANPASPTIVPRSGGAALA